MGSKKKRTARGWLYKGYEIVKISYYPPERRRVWEAVDTVSGQADFHGFTLEDAINWIDKERPND